MICIKKSLIAKILSLALCFMLAFVPVAYASSDIAQDETETKVSDWAKTQIYNASISEIKGLLENGSMTSEELCKIYLERINKYDKDGVKLNSIVSINTNALAQAKQLDLERKAGAIKGTLHGVPILVKDNIDVSGFPTTLGKESLSKEIIDEDAAAVKLLIDEGAIILGKTNMSTDDIATKYTVSSILGETRNVYDTKYSAGGTAGGAAVSVSACFAAAGLATDTDFSLAYPAALNGAVSYRPTFGLVDYTGCHKVVRARDTVAPVTRSVKDSAIMLDVITQNGGTQKYSKGLSKDSLKGKKIAVLKELSEYTYNSPNEFRNADKEIIKLFEGAKNKIASLGAEVIEVSVPKLFVYYNNCRESLSGSQNAKAKFKAEITNLMAEKNISAFIFPAYLSKPIRSGFDKYGDHLDAGENYLNCTGYFPSILGMPAICLPMGMHESGVGAGIEFVAAQNKDAELLSMAYSFEQGMGYAETSKLTPNLYNVTEKPDNIDTEKPEIEDTVADEKPKKDKGLPWQSITVWVIVAAILILCVWALLLGTKKPSKKGDNIHRHF